MQLQMNSKSSLLFAGIVLFALAAQTVFAIITVQIGGATRLNSLTRQRDRYNCYWDCDLVGCQIARDDDECAYDCEKICRVRYDYAGRSGAVNLDSANDLKPKSAIPSEPAKVGSGEQQTSALPASSDNEILPELVGAGTSVRLHLPRNASARNFAIWERCSPDASTGKLTEKPFNL